MLIMGCSLGNCVHVAGVVHFLNLARDEGYETCFLGPAIPIDRLMCEVEARRPDMVAVGYRLTAENGLALARELMEHAKCASHKPRWLFGGTYPVAQAVRELGFFEIISDGRDDIDDSIAFLRGISRRDESICLSDSLSERVSSKYPYPLLRHHFGLPSFEETVRGVERIADSRVLDVISLGPDQNTQQFFFRSELRSAALDGAGGVPIRSAEEFRRLKAASRRGNFPLMRCYSGTADVIEFAELLRDTINNAWCAVPLMWYNELDGRGERTVDCSVREAQQLIKWHAERNIPLEMNEPHHWGLRDAHDTISVAMAYIAAYNAKQNGIRDYISQYMFNIPSGVSFAMDLARVLAQNELVESLSGPDFSVYRQVRTGLPLLSGDLDVAKGQLAASTCLSMELKPHIIHVVGYSEAESAASPEVVIESCKIVRGAVRCSLGGDAVRSFDPAVRSRRDELLSEAKYLIRFIEDFYSASPDPLADPAVLADCVKRGIIDAPHIVKNDRIRGILSTRISDGRCLAWDEENGRPLTERERLYRLELAGRLSAPKGAAVI